MREAEIPGTHRDVAAHVRHRFDAHLRASGLIPSGSRITLALSGGVDSVVLLDLFYAMSAGWSWTLAAAHFDHRMREGSESDARWVAELCDGLGVPCEVERAARRPRNEADARRLRYRFLRRVREATGGGLLVTAHQADDQAETVLFRLLRGSGLGGLAGIPARREPGIVRPLLPFWRAEIEAYARARGLRHREDPTNRELGPARNWIRHRLIPELEAGEPELRARLVRLGELAGRAERGVRERVDEAAAGLIEGRSQSRIVVARSEFSAYDSPTRAHLLRALVGRVGPRPDRVGTRLALEFISRGQSGREIELGGGVRIRREFDRLYIEARRDVEPGPDIELSVPDTGSGEGEVRIAGNRWYVYWSLGYSREGGEPGEEVARFDPTELQFPLKVRGWQPGDRISLPAGTRKLKRLFVDRRVGLSRRRSYPILADAAGVLWVPGLARGTRAQPGADGRGLTVRLERSG